MKRLLSLLVLLSAMTAARAEAPATEWRRLAFLPAIKPDARVHRLAWADVRRTRN